MYGIISIISILVRSFLLKSAFEAISYGYIINILFAEPLLGTLSFTVTGMFYRKNSAPALGSALYLFFYIIHNFLLCYWVSSGMQTVLGIIIIIVYFSILAFIKRKIVNKFNPW
ncbi:hypothetical protein [Vallitalea okinawensis]|uniref:hypothetical protein n=1 Tax=Vallitalea okinawensis TaxID=2078660 RepID=UPI000CFD0670|nr:hypothetical protein [Vallitalea okinawensis]